MNLDIMVLSALSGISMAAGVMLCGTWYYELAGRDLRRMGKAKDLSGNDWLFSGFHETVYHFFFRKDPAGMVLGIDLSKYEKACSVLHPFTYSRLLNPVSSLLHSAVPIPSACR